MSRTFVLYNNNAEKLLMGKKNPINVHGTYPFFQSTGKFLSDINFCYKNTQIRNVTLIENFEKKTKLLFFVNF